MKPKKLLQRVLDFAFSELERRARPSDDAPEARGDEQLAAGSDTPFTPPDAVQTQPRTAREPTEPREHVQSAPAEQREQVESAPAERHEPVQHAHQVHGLEAVRSHQGEGLTLRWSLSPADVARARTLLSGKSVLCLRVVRFSTARDDVLREVQDRPGIELEGECELADAPERAVVSLGLRSGERFVSISHHVL